METKPGNPSQNSQSSFQPLPGGQQAAILTPERFREQLGWPMLQADRRS